MMEEMTEYERKRLENIKRNQEKLAALGVHSTAQHLRSVTRKTKSETKGFKTPKREREAEPTVIRRSLRTRGLSPQTLEGMGADSPSPVPKPPRKGFHVTAPESPNPRNKGPLSFADIFVKHREDASYELYLDRLKHLDDNAPLSDLKWSGSSQGGGDCRAAFGLDELKMKDENVIRISPGRIFCLQFLPCRERVVLLSGDKEGHLSLWDADCSEAEGHGLHIYHPHSSPISGIAIQPSSVSKVLTCSYDGCIRSMDIENEVFDMVYNTENELCAICSSATYQSVYFAEGSGKMKVLDWRAGGVSNSYSLHEKRINTIDFHPQRPHLVSTSSTDGTARIWDLRKIKKRNAESLATVHHTRAVHSSYFSPSGNYLATTSYDNSVGLLSGLDAKNIAMIYHYNPPNRWISSFRAIWGWDDRYIFIGNMERGLDAISTATKATTTLDSSLLTTIPTRLAKYPFNSGTLAGGTGGGKVFVWQKI